MWLALGMGVALFCRGKAVRSFEAIVRCIRSESTEILLRIERLPPLLPMEEYMTDLRRACGLMLALALVLGLQTAAYAQTGAASITGLVTDPSGAETPGVTVTATNQATNVGYSATSNQAGVYTITSVPVGTS